MDKKGPEICPKTGHPHRLGRETFNSRWGASRTGKPDPVVITSMTQRCQDCGIVRGVAIEE